MTHEQRGEIFRGGIHAFTGVIVAALGLYNLMRIAERGPESHLVVNVLVYGPLAVFEQYQVYRHFSAGKGV